MKSKLIVLQQAAWAAALLTVAVAQAAESFDPFPLSTTVGEAQQNLRSADVKATGLDRAAYLKVIAGIVQYFRHFQAGDGRIIDPFQHKEVQYSTPCYAWATAALIAAGQHTNLLESAAQALDSALQQLADAKAADGHGDFFTFPAMLAYEQLQSRVLPERRRRWEECLRTLNPTRAYRDVLSPKHPTVHNWNVVAITGEFLRSQAGFTDANFVERHLPAQLPYFTTMGLYRDPNEPMAYDHFPRHFLAAMLQRGYDGPHRAELAELLERGAWTSLLMQSPLGELPTGGRSAQHQWNEAEQCVTYEIWSARKQCAGDAVAARAFKRAAHLALQSIQRWTRSSGELWIVKNRFDPAARHGFEGYSSHSQYNLLTASMLAGAWLFADESIAEGPGPADVGGFAFEAPEFHKVFANAGGLYVELDTAADSHYNSTGLIRVHRRGVEPLIGPTDSSPIQARPLAVGVAWREGEHWQPLAGLDRAQVKSVRLSVSEARAERVRFSVRYEIGRPKVRAVVETYDLTPQQVRVTAEIEGDVDALQARFPALAFDGQRASQITLEGSRAVVQLDQSRQVFQVELPAGVVLRRAGPWIACRNGYLEAIEGEIAGRQVTYTLQPERW